MGCTDLLGKGARVQDDQRNLKIKENAGAVVEIRRSWEGGSLGNRCSVVLP